MSKNKDSHDEFVDKLARALLKTLENEKNKKKQTSKHHRIVFSNSHWNSLMVFRFECLLIIPQ